MRYIKILSLILLFGCIYASCERDDLCPETTQTTAKLFIEVFDFADSDRSKNISKLRITGLDREDHLIVTEISTGNTVEYAGIDRRSKIYLPLRTDADETRYILHKDFDIDDKDTPEDATDDEILGNPDEIIITYEREEVFVSRACGFRTVFKNVKITRDTADTSQWIKSISSNNENQSVEDEEEAHFILLH